MTHELGKMAKATGTPDLSLLYGYDTPPEGGEGQGQGEGNREEGPGDGFVTEADHLTAEVLDNPDDLIENALQNQATDKEAKLNSSDLYLNVPQVV